MDPLPIPTLPDSAIRGPELHAPAMIAELLARQDSATLTSYAQGVSWLLRVWRLLAIARRLEALRAEQQFLVHQLAVLEARHPQAVAAALARVAPVQPFAAGDGGANAGDALRPWEDELSRSSR